MNPRVSVIMAVYNAEAYLREAVDSILGQTFRDLELIVVDDGSEDGSWEILTSYADPRLCLIGGPHGGLEASLNAGIRRSQGELLARMDADDISLPDRLSRQMAFLDQHPELALVGCFCTRITESGRDLGVLELPCDSDDIRRFMVRDNPFVHSTILVRRAALDKVGPYDPSYRWGDYDLWVRVAAALPVANIPEALLIRREHSETISRTIPPSSARWERLRIQWKAARSLPASARSVYYLVRGFLNYAVSRIAEIGGARASSGYGRGGRARAGVSA